jgi:hypothetical protein
MDRISNLYMVNLLDRVSAVSRTMREKNVTEYDCSFIDDGVQGLGEEKFRI